MTWGTATQFGKMRNAFMFGSRHGVEPYRLYEEVQRYSHVEFVDGKTMWGSFTLSA